MFRRARRVSCFRGGSCGTAADGERLHVDVMRPTGAKGKTPLILVVSPYLGMTSPHGGPPPVEPLVGAALRPKGLAAVGLVRLTGRGLKGSPKYTVNSTSRSADCQAPLAEHYLDDPPSEFWTARHFVTKAKGSTVPIFMDRRLHLACLPSAALQLSPVAPRTDVAVNVYDVAPHGTPTMVTRDAATVDAPGEELVRLFPTDWTCAERHRVGVLVSRTHAEADVDVPTQTTVGVDGGTVTLPWMRAVGRTPPQGVVAPRLERYRETAPFSVDPAMVAERTESVPDPPRPTA